MVEGPNAREQVHSEHIPIARRSEASRKPLQFVLQPLMLFGREHRPHGRKHRAKSTHCYAHLVEGVGVAGQSCPLVAQQMPEANAARRLKNRIYHHGRCESERFGRGCLNRASQQPIAAFGAVGDCDPKMCRVEQLQRHIKKIRRTSPRDLEIEIAHRFPGVADSGGDLPFVECRRDLDRGSAA
jgi:hypothetical protein